MSEPYEPSFTDAGRELSEGEAFDAMQSAFNLVTLAALEARLSLLRLGFTVHHSACSELDTTAQRWADAYESIAHQRGWRSRKVSPAS